ncbi:hypothetical protein [Granulicella sp. S190]|uniref:hypothetical protein n=1 Tax=Granulicella sp. S190 TaxID=1747226 RepID=UPI00131D3E2B|nr:hypothetical protein [Granulicella sp. S190]
MRTLSNIVLVVVLAAQAAVAQDNGNGNESRIHSDFRREWLDLHPCREQLVKPCSEFTPGHLVGIGQALVTDQPLHLALGSLAPQNGFALGLAFVEHKDFVSERRLTFDTDAVATKNGSWRAGSCLTTYKLPQSNDQIVVVMGTPPPRQQIPSVKVAPVFSLYAEATSLNTLYFYGLGPNTVPAGKAAFGLTETIAGASALLPLNKAGISFTVEFNSRFPQLRPDSKDGMPTVSALYTEATAPGLTHSATFLQPGVGIQIQPGLFDNRLRLHYFANFQDFASLGGTAYSFRRWTADIGHEFALDRHVTLTAADPHNGPDACTPDGSHCPHISTTINNEGSVNLRLLLSGSARSTGNAVPFYFDPTTGGSNIDGNPILASYPDYRFRAANLVLIRGTVEHAIPKLPLGAYFSVDAGKSALTRNDIDFSSLRRSYSIGLTVHAGGLPVVYLLFAWGGNEGTHTTFSISNTLLGGTTRPSLF